MTQNHAITIHADILAEIEDQIRNLESIRDRLRADLAYFLRDANLDTAISTSGKTYKLSRPPARYTFYVPEEEMERLGILADCTPPPAPPKLTKTKLDDLLKRRRIEDDVVAEWVRQGWYITERSDEITVRQVETKQETLKASLGF